jgi:Protein of unknown function (DUF3617)
MTSHRAAGTLLLAALCLLALPALAAIQLAPGEWQDTENGTEDGHAVKNEVSTDCMTAAEARDPLKALSQLKATAGQQCKTMNVKEAGNTLAFDMECGDASTMSIAISMTFTFLDSRHYTGTVKSKVVFAGKTTTADKRIESKWIGAVCKKK